jgi:hypothetical protein
MTAEERVELTRDVAHIVAEALSPAMNTMARGFERIVALMETTVSLEARQEKLLEHIVERQDQMAEALGLVIQRLRRN